jgi:mannose-6-phosphate isomerase-like protein (cupin superfamily)
MSLVISGRLTIHLRARDVVLEPGEIFEVPRGMEHCPDAAEETRFSLLSRTAQSTLGMPGEMTAEPRML